MRFHVWSPLSDRRVTCPAGHAWSPGIVLRAGYAEVMCQQCRTPLLVVAVPALGRKVVLEGSRAEWEALLGQGLTETGAALWLLTQGEAA